MTTEEFLEWEANEEGRWEFDGVEPIAMTGGTIEHHMTVGSIRDALRPQLPRGCMVLSETFKLLCPPEIPTGEKPSKYPDVMVTCKPIARGSTTTDSAVLVVEVLSRSSVRRDKVEKLAVYSRLAELEACLIVDPAVRAVALYRRGSAGDLEAVDAGDDLGHGFRISLDEIYAGLL